MSASSPAAAPRVEVVEEKTTPTSSSVSSMVGVIALIPAIFALLFHLGAATLSYKRNQSIGWAILHFFFAVFYYPYFAFTQPSDASAGESSSILPTVQSAGRRIRSLVHGKRK